MISGQVQDTVSSASEKGCSVAPAGAAKIVDSVGDIPAMPHVAAMVMEHLSDPDANPREIHRLIEQDQGLAARVLKVANSPYYGASRSISTLKDAILFMGFDSIKSIMLTAVMKGVLANTGLAEKLLWEHSIGCAVAARAVAKAVRFPGREEAFLAGMMHDVGKPILFLKRKEDMSRIMQEVYNEGVSFAEAEMKTFGFTHSEVGQLVADKWRFTHRIEEAIACHHSPQNAKMAPQLSQIVSLGNLICHKLELGPTRRPDLDLTGAESARALGLDPDAIDEILEYVKTTAEAG